MSFCRSRRCLLATGLSASRSPHVDTKHLATFRTCGRRKTAPEARHYLASCSVAQDAALRLAVAAASRADALMTPTTALLPGRYEPQKLQLWELPLSDDSRLVR